MKLLFTLQQILCAGRCTEHFIVSSNYYILHYYDELHSNFFYSTKIVDFPIICLCRKCSQSKFIPVLERFCKYANINLIFWKNIISYSSCLTILQECSSTQIWQMEVETNRYTIDLDLIEKLESFFSLKGLCGILTDLSPRST